MPRFKVAVESDTPRQTLEALQEKWPRTVLATRSEFVGRPDTSTVGHRMTVMVDAQGKEAALEQVREVAGDDCDVALAT